MPHFDAEALLEAVHQQRLGLKIDTNNKEGFQRIVYETARARPDLPVHLYSVPGRPSQLLVLSKELPDAN